MRHGDIHPGNIFLSLQDPCLATLIDFGEGFLATPDFNWRYRNPNPYLAPERLGARLPLDEQIDVYSFGILLLYLATGTHHQFTHERRRGLHRSHVHELIHSVNPDLVRHEPRISDLIGRSTARDPADRPRMIEICDDLHQLAASSGLPTPTQDNISSAALLQRFAEDLRHVEAHNPVLRSLLDQQVRELGNVFAGLETEMVELSGTRDQMLRVLISLMEHLQAGDSWTTATTLAPWQRHALGLNGSYMSANIRAIRRRVAVRRTFVVSVAELGLEFSEKVAALLSAAADPALKKLGQLFRGAIDRYRVESARVNYNDPASAVVLWHRERFRLVTEWLHEFLTKWDLGTYINRDHAVNLQTSAGVYFGLSPVATLDDVGAKREDNPISLMHFANVKEEESKPWLLVSTEQRGRYSGQGGVEGPHLLGVRVYTSVMGRPNDRIQHLEKLMNKEAVNITSSTELLAQIINKAHREV